MRIDRSEIEPVLTAILLQHGFTSGKAELCAQLFTETTLDGVYSHGLNRFPLFIDAVKRGVVRPEKEPERVRSVNAFETWDGKLGPGNLNAWTCMGRAVELAKASGMGVVSLRNTNHWMRAGTYGLQAARENCIGVCMTNTTPNVPPWGGREATVGNNPMVIAVPHEPYPILLDMAMSQFSYGKMEVTEKLGQKLPFPGGFDSDLQLTDEPAAILESGLALPMGQWKGSALAIMIDLLVSVLSGGSTTREIGERDEEYAVSQLFAAFDLEQLTDAESRDKAVADVTESLLGTRPIEADGQAFYPGQRTWMRRQQNLEEGIPVDPDTWEEILELGQD